MKLRILSALLLFFTFLTSAAHAEITEQGTGMLFGSNHAFSITAPKGWVLDNESGVKQGVYMIFYPVGYAWANSPVIVYGRSVTKDAKTRSAKDQVAFTVKMFHDNGSLDYKVTKETSITLPNGKKAPVYYYAGDQWGNYEAAAYFEEKNTINFLVFNSRNKADFEKYIPAFEQMVRSYMNSGNLEMIDEKGFKELVKQAKQVNETPAGKEYEEKVIKGAGEALATIMRNCAAYIGDNEVKPFEAIFRIKPDGTISEAFVNPDTRLSTCFEGYFVQTKHPPHTFDSYLLHIDMKIN